MATETTIISQKSKELSQYINKLQFLTNEKQRPES